MLDWLVHSDGGLAVRIIAGCCIFAAMGIVDLSRHGRSATRWREYGVLAAAVVVALVYGVVNDQITSAISWEYFYYGKELDKVLGPTVPPEIWPLRWEAAKVGLKATWSAGLIFGVVLLLANNPFRNLPRLRNRELLGMLPVILLMAAGLGIVGGILGYEGFLSWMSADFQEMLRADIFRPQRFICTWGIHLGGYVGGFVGTFVAAGIIMRRRVMARRQTPAPAANTSFGQ
jgi:hypothetical protein